MTRASSPAEAHHAIEGSRRRLAATRRRAARLAEEMLAVVSTEDIERVFSSEVLDQLEDALKKLRKEAATR